MPAFAGRNIFSETAGNCSAGADLAGNAAPRTAAVLCMLSPGHAAEGAAAIGTVLSPVHAAGFAQTILGVLASRLRADRAYTARRVLAAKFVRWRGRARCCDGPRTLSPGSNKLCYGFALLGSELQEFKTMPDCGAVLGQRADVQGHFVGRQRKLQFHHLFSRAQITERGAQTALADVYNSPGYEFSSAQRNQQGCVKRDALVPAFRAPLRRGGLRAVIRHIRLLIHTATGASLTREQRAPSP